MNHAPQRVNRHLPRRFATYCLGLFLTSLATNISIIANLGLSGFNATSSIFSQELQISMGNLTIFLNCLMVVVQFLILRRDFQLIILAQVPFAFIYGKFVIFSSYLLPDVIFHVWYIQLPLLLFAVFLMALGILVYMGTELACMPVEGAALVISSKSRIPFYRVKMMLDCSFLTTATLSALYFYGSLSALGLGTVAFSVGTGWTIGRIKKYLPRWIQNWHLS